MTYMRLTRNYEYAYGLIKARMGNQLKQHDFEAILGCKETIDLTRVLKTTVYGESLIRSKVNNFEDIVETITASASNYVEDLTNSIPKSDLEILCTCKKVIESRSFVNFLKTEIKPGNVLTKIDVIPFGSFPLNYYDHEAFYSKKNISPELFQILEHSIFLSKKHGSIAPLLNIILFFCELVPRKIPKSNGLKWRSLSRLMTHVYEATLIELNVLGIQSGIVSEISEEWVSFKEVLKKNRINIFLPKKIEQTIDILKGTRYGICLEDKYEKNVDDVLERFPYCVMAKEAHSILAGYPFLPSTVAAGIMLILIEIRNIKLGIAAVEGKLDKLRALRLMTIS